MHLSKITLLFLIIAGCIGCSKQHSADLSTEWTQNKEGTLDTLLVKRKGVVVASISAVSNAYSVAATGTDGVEDVSVTYYDPPDGSATAPDTVTRTIKRPDGLIDFIRYDSKGEIEKKVSFDPNAPPTKSQQGASQGPSSTGAPQRRIIREK